MVYCLNDYDEYFKTGQPTKSGIYLRQSEDGINWNKPPQKIISVFVVLIGTALATNSFENKLPIDYWKKDFEDFE